MKEAKLNKQFIKSTTVGQGPSGSIQLQQVLHDIQRCQDMTRSCLVKFEIMFHVGATHARLRKNLIVRIPRFSIHIRTKA